MWTKWIKFVKLVTDGPVIQVMDFHSYAYQLENTSRVLEWMHPWIVQIYEIFTFLTAHFSISELVTVTSRPQDRPVWYMTVRFQSLSTSCLSSCTVHSGLWIHWTRKCHFLLKMCCFRLRNEPCELRIYFFQCYKLYPVQYFWQKAPGNQKYFSFLSY